MRGRLGVQSVGEFEFLMGSWWTRDCVNGSPGKGQGSKDRVVLRRAGLVVGEEVSAGWRRLGPVVVV